MYADGMTVAAARELYFRANGFSLAGYTDRWVKLKLGPIPIAFPNTAGRIAAVKLHDLHHVATEYTTTWTGEAEIGAWEIGAGCGRFWAAWFLNLSAFGIGLWIAPRRTFRAFVRGRRSTSLYRRATRESAPREVERMLALDVGALRRELDLPAAPSPAGAGDVIAYLAWLKVSFLVFLLAVSPIAIPIVLLAF